MTSFDETILDWLCSRQDSIAFIVSKQMPNFDGIRVAAEWCELYFSSNNGKKRKKEKIRMVSTRQTIVFHLQSLDGLAFFYFISFVYKKNLISIELKQWREKKNNICLVCFQLVCNAWFKANKRIIKKKLNRPFLLIFRKHQFNIPKLNLDLYRCFPFGFFFLKKRLNDSTWNRWLLMLMLLLLLMTVTVTVWYYYS